MFISHHSYAVEIEHIMRNVFNLDDRGGFGGVADADYAESNPYSAISCSLAVYYNNVSGDKKDLIDKYLESFYFNKSKSIIDLGETEIKDMIRKFKDLLKVLQN